MVNEAVENALHSGGDADFEDRLLFPDDRTKHLQVLENDADSAGQ
jgi:hypothetical protein